MDKELRSRFHPKLRLLSTIALYFALFHLMALLPANLRSGPIFQALTIPEGHAAVTFVRNIGTAQNRTSHAQLKIAVADSSVPVGSTIIVAIAADYESGDGDTLPQCSDSKGNSYDVDIDSVTSNFRLSVASAYIATALNVSDTITITHYSMNASTASANEFSGLASSGSLDRTQKGAGTSTTASSGNALTTTQTDELLFGAIAVEGPASDGFAAGSGYSALARDGTTGGSADSNVTVNPEYRIVSAAGVYAADGTLGINRSWVAAIATYRVAGGPTISVSVSDSTFAFGTTLLNSWLTAQMSVIRNNGTVAENFLGRISQLAEGANTWALSSSANGSDTIRAQWSKIGASGPWNDITAYSTDFTFATDIAASDSLTIWFRIETPTTTASYDQFSSTLTVTAIQH